MADLRSRKEAAYADLQTSEDASGSPPQVASRSVSTSSSSSIDTDPSIAASGDTALSSLDIPTINSPGQSNEACSESEEEPEEETDEYDYDSDEQEVHDEVDYWLVRDREAVTSTIDHNMDELLRSSVPRLEDFTDPAPRTFNDIAILFDEAARATYLGLSHELKQMIFRYALPAFIEAIGRRQIRAIFNHREREWTYLSTEYVNNTYPLLFHTEGKSLKSKLVHYYKPAPRLGGAIKRYNYFIYDFDTLVLEYNRCGSDGDEQTSYDTAVREAAESVVDESQHGNLTKEVNISYCPHSERRFSDILDLFKPAIGLRKVRLLCHDHYGDYLEHPREKDDYLYMAGAWKPKAWAKRQKYPFKVQLFDHNGDEIKGNEYAGYERYNPHGAFDGPISC